MSYLNINYFPLVSRSQYHVSWTANIIRRERTISLGVIKNVLYLLKYLPLKFICRHSTQSDFSKRLQYKMIEDTIELPSELLWQRNTDSLRFV